MIQLTLKETFEAYLVLKKNHSKEYKHDKDFLGYQLAKLEASTLEPAKLFENIRDRLIKEIGVEKDGFTFIPSEKQKEYEESLNKKLSEIESEMKEDLTFKPIKLYHFEKYDVSPEFFIGMGKLIDDTPKS